MLRKRRVSKNMRPQGIIKSVPKKVVRFEQGDKQVIENVPPTPFNKKRAQEIMDNCHPMCGDLQRHMKDGEIAYVLNIWDAIPSGNSSFVTAFNAIVYGDV